jgi:hypothetical protein
MARQFLYRDVVLERKRGRHGLGRLDERDFGAGEREQEILKPRTAAELAVRDDLKTHVLLEAHHIEDRLVFDLPQLFELQRA